MNPLVSKSHSLDIPDVEKFLSKKMFSTISYLILKLMAAPIFERVQQLMF